MDLDTAINTLNELVGRTLTRKGNVEISPLGPLFRVVRIDYFSQPDLRCVIGCKYPNGSLHLKRRPVGDFTGCEKYFDAEAVISAAEIGELRRAVEQN